MIIGVLATAFTPNFSQVQKGTITTAAGGTFAVVFSPVFTNVPQVFVSVTDGTDALVKVSNKSTSGFTITVRLLATSSFLTGVSTTSGSAVTSLNLFTNTNAQQFNSSSSLWAAASSGGATTTGFTAYQLSSFTAVTNVTTNTSAFITSVSSSSGSAVTGWANAGAVQIDWVALA